MNGVLSISGSNGGPVGRGLSQALKGSLHRLFDGHAGIQELRCMEATLPRRRSLTMLVNNECNLACRHCYLQLPKASRQRLTAGEWNRAIDSALAEGIEHFVIAGKEVFLGQNGPAVVDHLGGIKRAHPNIRTGLITNGTLIHNHRERIEAADLTYIDVSMEGAEADHDAIRGAGSFAAVRSNVEWAATTLGERLFVTLTLQKRNLNRFSEALLAFSSLGVKNVGASFFCPLPYTDRNLDLSEEDFRLFFNRLQKLGSLSLDSEMAVQVDAGIVSPNAVTAFMQSEWFSLESMEVDRSGFLYSRFRFCNGLLLCFRYIPWPLAITHSSRLTVDGELVCVDDSLSPRLYHLNSLGNIRDHGFDFGSLTSQASNHPRLAHLNARYEAEILPSFRKAFRAQEKALVKVEC
jgi:MoaA/NifB/PqqE/SkfB family radical SAM enzyme